MLSRRIALGMAPYEVVLILALCALLAGAGCSPGDPQNVVRVGVLLPLSGDAMPWGQSMREGIELARETLEKGRGADAPGITLLFEDDRGLPREGVSAAEKLTAVDRVQALVGVANSSVALAILPVLERRGVVFVSGGASSPELSGASPLFFRTWPSDLAEATGMARYARRVGWDSVAILYINNEYGVGLLDPFRAEFSNLGGVIVATETFPQEATDFRTQLLRVAASRPQAVYLVGNPREMGRCLRQAAEMGLNLQFLSTSAFREDELLSIAGSAAEGVLFTDASYDTDTDYPAGQAFLHAFRAKYGRDPGMLAATGYDALRVVVTAILETDGTTDAIVQYLRNLEAFPGAAGPLTFDERGDVSRPVRISVVSEGRFVTKERLY